MLGQAIVFWVNADAGNAEVLGGCKDAYGYFPAVCDEQSVHGGCDSTKKMNCKAIVTPAICQRLVGSNLARVAKRP